MPFTARQTSTCSVCQLPINVGDPIRWSKRDSALGRWHAHCIPTGIEPRTLLQRFDSHCATCNADLPKGRTVIYDEGARTVYCNEVCYDGRAQVVTKPKPVQPHSEPFSSTTTLQHQEPIISLMPSPVPKLPVAHNGHSQDLFALMAAAIQPHIVAQVGDLDARIADAIQNKAAELAEFINTKLAAHEPQTINHTYTVTSSTGTVTLDGQQHELFVDLLALIELRLHVYLWGDAGSGKSTAGIKAAEALGLEHGYISLAAQTPESRLMGYLDANGRYVETEFYRRYKNGGVFVIDEMDNASANLLTSINSALENGSASFPCGIIAKHADFVLIATGNTPALGANPMFPDRRPLDGAFRERFVFVEWNTDNSLEMTLALQHNENAREWVKWVQNVRAYAKTSLPRLLVTQRASIRGARLLKQGRFTPERIAHMVLFKGVDADSVRKVLQAYPVPMGVR